MTGNLYPVQFRALVPDENTSGTNMLDECSFDVAPSPAMGAQLNLAPQLGAASKEGKGGIGLGVRKEEAP